MPFIDDSNEKTKHTLWLFAGDMQKMKDIFGERKASATIRAAVRTIIKKVEASKTQVEDEDLDLDHI